MNYKSFSLGDWIGHISGVIEDETTLDGNEMRDLVEFLTTLNKEPCEDAISRKKVLNTLFYNSDNNCEVVLNKELQDRIKSLPPVTPPTKCIATVKFSKEDMQELINEKMKDIVVERKKGKWIYVGDNCFKCSECGEVYTIDQFNHINNYCDNRFPKGCPTCATEMENEE